MKLAAVVVLYNPEDIGFESVLHNICSYEDFVLKIYLVDNSNCEHLEITDKLKNAVYIFNGNKGGIGGAQNVGCKMAFEEGFDYVITMDMDTFFEKTEIRKYIHFVENYLQQDSAAVCFSCRAENMTNVFHWSDILKKPLRPLKRFIFGGPNKLPSYELKERCIASANILNLKAWKRVGGFNENLFIDQVDYEFCYRLREKEYKIIKYNDSYMSQHFGEAHGFTLFRKHYAKYSSFRFYHCIRNSIIVKRKYPQYKKFYNEYIFDLFFDNCINSIHAIRNLRIFLKACRDSRSLTLV